MNESHDDKTGSKLSAIEYQDKIRHIHKKSFTARMGIAGKTPWDFVQLLLVPIMLAAVGFGFTLLSNQMAEAQRHETILKTYLDDMTKLYSEMKLDSQDPTEKFLSEKAPVVARAKTLTALRQLDKDGDRKGLLIQFLSEAHLITVVDKSGPVISLQGADLSGANLTVTNLSGATLEGANLENATLEGANLSSVDLEGANLSRSKLHGANLSVAHLRLAKLERADLSEADLRSADLSEADLSEANLREAKYSIRERHPETGGTLGPTQWPRGVNPTATGAIEDNTLP